jgi:hypothetical protein
VVILILDVKGIQVLVDDEDFEKLSAYNWGISLNGTHKYVIARPQTNKIRQQIYMHRMLMDTPKGMFTDHINGNTFDNRKSNLRICTNSQNSMNRKTHKSKFKGVALNKKSKSSPWMATVKINGKQHRRYARTEKEAAYLYNELARTLFGEFASLNVIKED